MVEVGGQFNDKKKDFLMTHINDKLVLLPSCKTKGFFDCGRTENILNVICVVMCVI